jgi:glycosyltransferase involved in cell wall biosynthesis
MNILLLSAYDAGSHKHWCQQIVAGFPQASFTLLSLPGRYFSWRIRGNPLSFFTENFDQLNQPYELVLATSMVDLATLRGLVPALSNTPCALYFHENQFEYPKSDNQRKDVDPAMINLYSALAADTLIFNSQFNRDSFIQGVDALLKKLPDHCPESLSSVLSQKSHVIPVPIDEPSNNTQPINLNNSTEVKPTALLWNHRWEYDKGPERLYYFLQALNNKGINFTLAVVGESFRNSPKIFDTIQKEFSSHITHWGYLPKKEDYLNLLAKSDVVLSTAIHEFQGLAVLEAVSYGCIPLVPDRLAYREIFPAEYRYPSIDDSLIEADGMASKLEQWLQDRIFPEAPNVDHFYWKNIKEQYKQKLNIPSII